MMLVLSWLIKNETENICFYHKICIETKYNNLTFLIHFFMLNLANYGDIKYLHNQFLYQCWFAFVLNGQAAMTVYSTASEYKC